MTVKYFNVERWSAVGAEADSVDWRMDQWRAERPDLDPSPMGVVARIQRACRLLEREISRNFARHDLQLWEFDMLSTLLRSGPPYRLSAAMLGASTMVTSGAITNRADRLVARGLVTRDLDPNNRRSVLIGLTEAGRELVGQAVTAHVDFENELLSNAMTDTDRSQLAAMLRALLIGLGDKPSSQDRAGMSPSTES